MRITKIKTIKNRKKAVELLRSGKIKGDNIVILWQYTGLAWLNPIITTDNTNDIVTILDNIYNDTSKNDLPFPLYHIDEIDIDYLEEYYIPINGGEYYTNIISHIEQI